MGFERNSPGGCGCGCVTLNTCTPCQMPQVDLILKINLGKGSGASSCLTPFTSFTTYTLRLAWNQTLFKWQSPTAAGQWTAVDVGRARCNYIRAEVMCKGKTGSEPSGTLFLDLFWSGINGDPGSNPANACTCTTQTGTTTGFNPVPAFPNNPNQDPATDCSVPVISYREAGSARPGPTNTALLYPAGSSADTGGTSTGGTGGGDMMTGGGGGDFSAS